MNETQRIKEAAQRLEGDDVLQRAFDGAVMDAWRELEKVDPTNSLAITALQAQIAAVAKIRTSLHNLILQAPQERISGLAPVARLRGA